MSQAVTQSPPPQDEVAMLLARCAMADQAAFRLLYDQQSPTLYALALRITRDASLASDAVHDAMLQVWRNAVRFDPARGSGRAWLVSLVRYRALDARGARSSAPRCRNPSIPNRGPWSACNPRVRARPCIAAWKPWSRPGAAWWSWPSSTA